MKTTIEAVKDEVAKKNGYPILVNTKEWTRWDRMFEEATSSTKEQLLHEVVELYHTRKCEEDFKSIMLPVKSEIKEMQQSMGTSETFDWVLKRCSAMLASLQSQLEAKDKEIEYLKHCEKAREEETEGWERLKVIAEENYPIEKIVGRDVSLVIEKLFKELKSQLQETKAEVEKLKGIIELKDL